MEQQALVSAFKTALKEDREENKTVKHEFWIDREPHYEQHKSLEGIGTAAHEVHHGYTASQLEFWGWVRETAVRAVVYAIVGGTISLIAVGFLVWVKYGDAISKLVGN
jgi:hypothetical protein